MPLVPYLDVRACINEIPRVRKCVHHAIDTPDPW